MCSACGSQKGVWIPWIWNYRGLWAPCGSWELILTSTNDSNHLSNPSFLFISLNFVDFYSLSVACSQSAGFSDMAPSVLHWLPSSQCPVERWAYHWWLINMWMNATLLYLPYIKITLSYDHCHEKDGQVFLLSMGPQKMTDILDLNFNFERGRSSSVGEWQTARQWRHRLFNEHVTRCVQQEPSGWHLLDFALAP